MKEIFDWLREQIVYTAEDVSPNIDKLLVMHNVERLINKAEAKWEAERATTEAEIRNKAYTEFAEKLKWELGQLIFSDSEKFA